MAIKLTLLSVDIPARATIDILVQAALTGNYPSGGEILDFSTLAGQQSQEGGILDSDLLPSVITADSQASNNGYSYLPQSFTAGAPPVPLTWKTCKLHILYALAANGTIGTELSAGAYASTLLQDQIIIWARFWRER